MALSDLLHDAIDAREEFSERARAIVSKVMRERLAEALEITDGFEDALMLIVKWASEELDGLTTEAVREGARQGMRREKRRKKREPEPEDEGEAE